MNGIKTRLIDLTLAAAPVGMSGMSRMARDWEGANRILAGWAVASEGRLSCDFSVMFEDGFTYRGTMEFGSGKDADITSHIDRLMSSLLSDDAEGAAWRKAVDPTGAVRKDMAAIREHYDLGRPAPAAALGR